jgi:hypothetical protein
VGELMKASRLWRWIAVALLLFAFVRMASLILAQPMAGYANQYDMHRSSACLGLWPEDVPIAQATPEAPRVIYRAAPALPAECYPSTQVGVAFLAMAADRMLDAMRGSDPKRMSLRTVGTIGLLMWVLGAALVARMLWRQPALLVAHALASALLIADPFNTLYLNTLYTEFPALCAAYFAAAIVLSLWLDFDAPYRRLLGLAACLLLLGLSRVQHLVLPLVLAVFAILALWRAGAPWWRPALLLLSCCCIVIVFQASQQRRFEGIARANLADSVLGAAMPAGDPERIASALGMDARCGDLAYSTWYRQHGVDVFAECPELAQVSRLRLLSATLRDPSVFARMMLRGVLMSQNLRLGYLGERAGLQSASVSKSDSWLWFSVADPVNRIPALWFLWLATSVLAAVPMFWIAVLRHRRAGIAEMRADSLAIVLCAHILAITALSSVFGDGYSEVGRHLHLGLNALLVALGMLPIWVLRRCLPGPLRTLCARDAVLPASIMLVWLVAATVAVLRLPLAFGVLGAPAGAVPQSGIVVLRGWALDLRPIERVIARVDGRELVALAPVHHHALDQVFPYLPGSDQGGFAGSIDAEALAGGRFLEIVAIDAAGRDVLIERRRLR